VTSAAALTRMRLPNGCGVLQVNQAETSLQYRDIVATRAYLAHALRLERGATVFDVGANIGISTLFFHWEAPDVRVFSFEPVPILFEALAANVASHGVDAVLFDCGLGRARGRTRLVYYPDVTVMSSAYADPEHDAAVTRAFLVNSGFGPEDVDDLMRDRHETETVECELRTVSDVINEHAVERVDLLKVNVEKAEADVLEGIEECHWPKVRQVTMQVHDVAGRARTMCRDLERRGFESHLDQDPLLAGTDIFDLYARRRDNAGGRR
jgi:31-O-methyltransferase